MVENCTVCSEPLDEEHGPIQSDIDGTAAHLACLETTIPDEEE